MGNSWEQLFVSLANDLSHFKELRKQAGKKGNLEKGRKWAKQIDLIIDCADKQARESAYYHDSD